ncbi:hypothetical protein C8F01DRAFT_1098940 [Mycena amicta]|nr:hypothetical protein C8F01DRAFT_1098940 [Mycena amicta]
MGRVLTFDLGNRCISVGASLSSSCPYHTASTAAQTMSSNATDYAAVLPVREVYFDMALIEALFYGLYVALFFVTASTIVARGQTHLNSIGLHLVVVLMFILASIHMATRWSIVKSAFVYNGDTPLTTAAYLSSPPFTVEVLEATVFTTNTLFSDLILVWRCWTIWGRDARIIVVPALSTVTGAILGYLSVVQQGRMLLHEALPDAYVQFSVPYFILSLCTTLLCTLLIILRIVLMTRQSLGKLRSYGAVIEMVVESAALYSATLIVLIALGSARESDGYPQAILGPMTGIAPTLIVARVSLGLSRPDPSWNSKFNAGASSIRFRSQMSTQPSGTVLSLSTSEEQEEKV